MGRRRVTTEEFIARAKVIHGDKYDYSLVNCKLVAEKVKIFCIKHNKIFEQVADAHLAGKGCILCGREKHGLSKRRASANEFVRKANEIHGFRYDYSAARYNTATTLLTIICKKHGEFLQTPNVHLDGSGCPCCADYGFNPEVPAVIYVYEIIGKDHIFTGFGITRDNNTRSKRHIKNLSTLGYSVQNSFVSEKIHGKLARDVEILISNTYPLDNRTHNIPGFKTESTTTTFSIVAEFVKQQILIGEQHAI